MLSDRLLCLKAGLLDPLQGGVASEMPRHHTKAGSAALHGVALPDDIKLTGLFSHNKIVGTSGEVLQSEAIRSAYLLLFGLVAFNVVGNGKVHTPAIISRFIGEIIFRERNLFP